jgi:hypothetical protein
LLLGAFLGTLVNWIFYRKAEKPKQLAWTRISGNLIISATEDQREDLSVVYRGRSVNNPYIMIIRITNVGKQEIREADFTEPISIDFGTAELLANDVIGKSNPKLKGRFAVDTSEPNLVKFTPELLNRDEWVEFQFVTDGVPGQPIVDTRFAGQAAPILNMEERRHRTATRRSALIIAAVVLPPLLAFSAIFVDDDKIAFWLFIPLFGLLSLFSVFCALMIVVTLLAVVSKAFQFVIRMLFRNN